MTVKAIIVNTPENEINSDAHDWASIFNSIFGDDSGILSYGEKLKLIKVSDNVVKLLDGVYTLQGHLIKVGKDESYELNVESGTLGMQRVDSVVVEYRKSVDTEMNDSFTFKVLKGAPVPTSSEQPGPPSLVVQDLLSDGNIRQEQLYILHIVDDQLIQILGDNNYINTINDLKYLMKQDLGGTIVEY